MAASPVLPPSPVSPATPASKPEAPRLSEGARILNTFIAPSKTFTDLRRNASWWGPWLLISICSLLFVYAMGRQIGFEQISKNQVAHSSRAEQFDKLPPEQQAKQEQRAAGDELQRWCERIAATAWSEAYAYFMHEPTAPAYARMLLDCTSPARD